MHQTIDLEDGYMGSGKLLKRAVNKYGIENFTKKIIHVFETEDDMRSKEAELVNEEYVARDDTYNLCQGGKGGFGYINRTVDRKILNNKISQAMKSSDKVGKYWLGKKHTDITKAKMSKSQTGRQAFIGKSHTDSSKLKMSKAKLGKYVGSKNSQYGTCWITDGVNNKKVSKENLKKWLTDGWKRGRSV